MISPRTYLPKENIMNTCTCTLPSLFVVVALAGVVFGGSTSAVLGGGSAPNDLPVRRVALFSSGRP